MDSFPSGSFNEQQKNRSIRPNERLAQEVGIVHSITALRCCAPGSSGGRPGEDQRADPLSAPRRPLGIVGNVVCLLPAVLTRLSHSQAWLPGCRGPHQPQLLRGLASGVPGLQRGTLPGYALLRQLGSFLLSVPGARI